MGHSYLDIDEIHFGNESGSFFKVLLIGGILVGITYIITNNTIWWFNM